MTGMKGRNEEVAEDMPGNEGQGQRRGLLALTGDDFFGKSYPTNVGKLYKKPNPQLKAFDSKRVFYEVEFCWKQ